MLLNNYSAIIIPDIQRDYVLGSGGENLKNLLDVMRHAALTKGSFNFSCIMGYVNQEDNTLAIYDGQQRITTLIYLCAYLCQNELNNESISHLLKKFNFVHRDEANDYLQRMLSEQNPELTVVDFTTFSILNLLDEFKKKQSLHNPSLDFLLNHVYMEFVLIDKVGDVEQFFIDLNDGLDLKDYEIFKAELYHRAKKVLCDDFKTFALIMENEWLQLFKKFKRNNEVEEEIAILFIQYCLHMIWIEDENQEDYNASDIQWIEKRHLQKLEEIMRNILALDLDENTDAQFVNYAYGKKKNCIENSDIANGVFWNLSYIHYPSLLRIFLQSFYEKGSRKKNLYQIKDEAKFDVVLWAYISNLSKPAEVLYEYLRTIKLLLNKNIIENRTAYYDDEHRIWFAAYSAYGIPSYYSKLNNSFARFKKNENRNNYLQALILLNKSFPDFSKPENHLETENSNLASMIHIEQHKRQSARYEHIRQLENLPFLNGFVDNLLNDAGEPIIRFQDLLKKLRFTDYLSYESIDKVVGNLLNQFSYLNVENVEHRLFKQSLYITWHVYTGNIGKYFEQVKLVLQTLTDFFIEKNLKPVLQAWINDDYCTKEKTLTEPLLYIRGYKYMVSTGFYTSNNEVVTVKNWDGDKSGLYSSRPQYGYPYYSYRLNAQFHRFTNDLNLDGCELYIKNQIYLKRNTDSFKEAITTNTTFYCGKIWVYYTIIDTYIKPLENGTQHIRNLMQLNKEIINVQNNAIYVPHSIMSDFLLKS